MLDDFGRPLLNAVAYVIVLGAAKAIYARKALRRHGGGALGFILDALLLALPMLPTFFVGLLALQVTTDGNPNWPRWAVWGSIIPAFLSGIFIYNVRPFEAAEARLKAASRAAGIQYD